MKLRYLLSSALALAAMSACTDLDTDINTKYLTYPDNPIATEGKLVNCYYYFRGQLQRDYKEGQTCSSDEMTPISFDGDYAETRYTHAYFHNFDPEDPSIGVWGDMAAGIVTCNNVILELAGSTDSNDPIIAPVRAMRAFYHFILMDCYGDVPLGDHNPDDTEAVERAPRAEIAKFIESELLDIIPQLSEETGGRYYGRPNKWMAEAMLAKLYINWAVYTAESPDKYTPSATNSKLNDCVAAIDDIINSGKFSLGDSHREKFFPSNGAHIKDFIYAMEYDPSKGYGHDYARYCTWRQAGKCTPNPYYGFPLAKSVGGNLAVTPEFADLFCLEGDERNDVIIRGDVYMMDPSNYQFTNEPCLYNGEQLHFTRDITLKVANDPDNNVGKSVEGWSMGYKAIKFPPRQEDYDVWSRSQTNDIPIYRYADMLLLKAEAILRGASATNGDTPESLINQVRTCSKAQLFSGKATLQDVLDERGRELFMENWRRNDLIRYGKFEDTWGTKKGHSYNNTDPRHRIFPVPKGIMDTNANWSQNPGY